MHGHKTSHLPIRYFLALLWAHTILHVSRIRVKGQNNSIYTISFQTLKPEKNDFPVVSEVANIKQGISVRA